MFVTLPVFPVIAVGVCPSPYVYNPHSDTCFRLMNDTATWDDANNTCRGAGKYLVTFAAAAASQWLRAKAFRVICRKFT